MTEPILTYVVRLLIALAIGGAIGLEREFKDKPAGIRTNILMCMGSCLIMILSLEVARASVGTADPGRIAAQVVTGVGFLGAGTIIRSRFHVSGLTTAATIWILSALGLAIGAGYILLATVCAFLITITLIAIRYIEDAIGRRRTIHVIRIVLDPRPGVIGAVFELLAANDIMGKALEIDRTGATWEAIMEFSASPPAFGDIVALLSEMEGVRGVSEM
jgi:putative Mg2+ transporter-C (MgtC) family protein